MSQKVKIDFETDELPDYEWPVTIPQTNPGKKPLIITFTFKGRDRVQYAEWYEAFMAGYVQKKEAEPEGAESDAVSADGEQDAETARDKVMKQVQLDIKYLREFALGWNVDAPYDDAHLTKLLVKYPGAWLSTLKAYGVSIVEGRLGNSAR